MQTSQHTPNTIPDNTSLIPDDTSQVPDKASLVPDRAAPTPVTPCSPKRLMDCASSSSDCPVATKIVKLGFSSPPAASPPPSQLPCTPL